MAAFESYTCRQGDMVDLIAFRRFGASNVMTEAILDANPGLAARGEVLPAGLVIKIPLPDVKPRTVTPRLWD